MKTEVKTRKHTLCEKAPLNEDRSKNKETHIM